MVGLKKFFFRPFGPQFGLKIRSGGGGGGGSGTPPQDPPLVLSNICTTGARPGLLGKDIFYRYFFGKQSEKSNIKH